MILIRTRRKRRLIREQLHRVQSELLLLVADENLVHGSRANAEQGHDRADRREGEVEDGIQRHAAENGKKGQNNISRVGSDEFTNSKITSKEFCRTTGSLEKVSPER
jgi:hypothetical protein